MEQVEQKERSIFQYILDEMGTDSLPEGFSLKHNNKENSDGAVYKPDGAEDAQDRYVDHNYTEEIVSNMVEDIESAIVLMSNGSYKEADLWFAKMGAEYGIINVAGIIHEYIEENKEDLYADNVFEGALYLMTESSNAESVKAGIMVLDHFEYEFEIKNILRILGLCSEFTFYVAMNMLDWNNGNGEIFQLAHFVSQWGLVAAMEVLEPKNKYIKDWMLSEGLENHIPEALMTDGYREKIQQVKNTEVKDEYLYCKVVPYGLNRSYSYIFPDDDISVGDVVIVPLGAENRISLGDVVECSWYSGDQVPYPVSKTKHIIRVVDESEMSFIEKNFNEDEDNQENEDIAGFDKVMDLDEYEEHDDERNDLSGEKLDDDDCEYDEYDEYDDEDDDEDYALGELAFYMDEEDDDEVLDWARRYHDTLDAPRIMEKVIEAYKYCVERNYRIDIAALNLGSIYYCGTAVPVDYKKAAKYYQMAAKMGSDIAMCNLGYCFMYGRHQEADMKKAYECFNMAAILGNSNAMYKLGDMYLYGQHVEKNENLAYKLYSRSYSESSYNDTQQADVEMRLGKCYLYGIGVEKNLDVALARLTEAMRGLYQRRKSDPFAQGILETCKGLLNKCQQEMDQQFVKRK